MRRRKRDREGSTAIEFAMLAMPFFFLLFGILEIGMLLLLDAVVETAVSDTGRLVRTGQAQQQTLTTADIKQKLCARMSVFSADCPSRAFIDVRVVDSFTTPIAPNPLSSGVFDQSKLTYQPGAPGDRVMVRIWYEQPIVTPFIAQALSRSTDHKVWLTTTLAFRNEPYQ
ncbi:TadE/TadG family type IV pilus assembly protein [Brevundimonas sp.]|uniref:TadE/TadG family type IV pilus assembly protein n=1 Tax=Brevundimonas sp. TaxID=1871086 RepID=UPI00289D29F4|nr:TadE/TadG family type IV pilus assembly protein [Brevundimonas sp.]